jgi:hypothetical protein
MATSSAIAKRTEKRQIEILEAVNVLMIEVADLKAEIAGLKAEIGGLKFTTATSAPVTTRRTKK